MNKSKQRPNSSNFRLPNIKSAQSQRIVIKKVRPQSVDKFIALANKSFVNPENENREIHKALKEMNNIVNDLLFEDQPKSIVRKKEFRRSIKKVDEKNIETEISNGVKFLEMQNSLIKKLEARLNLIQTPEYIYKLDDMKAACIQDSIEYSKKLKTLTFETKSIEKSFQNISDPRKNPLNGKIILIETATEKEEATKKSLIQEKDQITKDIENYKGKCEASKEKYAKLVALQNSKKKTKDHIKQEDLQKKISTMEKEITVIKHSFESQRKMRAKSVERFKELGKELDIQILSNDEDLKNVKKRIIEIYSILKLNGIVVEDSELLGNIEIEKEMEIDSNEIKESVKSNEFIQKRDSQPIIPPIEIPENKLTKEQLLKNIQNFEESSQNILVKEEKRKTIEIPNEQQNEAEVEKNDDIGKADVDKEALSHNHEEEQLNVDLNKGINENPLPNKWNDYPDLEPAIIEMEKRYSETIPKNYSPEKEKNVVNRSSAVINESLHLNDYLNSSKDKDTSNFEKEETKKEAN